MGSQRLSGSFRSLTLTQLIKRPRPQGSISSSLPRSIITPPQHSWTRSISARATEYLQLQDPDLTESQRTVREAISKVCSKFDDAYWANAEKEHRFPTEFHQAVAKDGWLGICMPAEYGGSDLGIAEAAIMVQTIAESGAAYAGASAVHMNIFGLEPVRKFGTDEQKRRMLVPLIAGQHRACFGVTEPNTGLDTLKLQSRAVKDPLGRRRALPPERTEDLDLDGAGGGEDPDPDAHDAAGQSHQAQPGPQPVLHGPRPHAGPGDRDPQDGARGRRLQHAVLRQLESPRGGPDRRGRPRLQDDHARHERRTHPDRRRSHRHRLRGPAARGPVRGERHVFGRPIGQNQGVQHPLATSWMELEAARLTIYQAARLYDSGYEAGEYANAAKFLAAEAAYKACERAVLAHGGMGYAKEYHVERYFREVMIPRIAPVSREMIMNYIGQRVLGLPKSY